MADLEPIAGDVLAPLDELAATANREHRLARDSAQAFIEHVLAAGQALLDAKAQVGHREWMPWVEANFDGSHRTATDYMAVAANWQRAANLDAPGLSLRAILKRLERVNRENPQLPEVEAEYVYDDVTIRHGDLRGALADVVDAAAIVTDPPYPAEHLDEWDALAALAARALEPGGVLAAMSGQTWLPDVLERLGRHLDYRWCGAYLTDGPATRIHGRAVGTKWKPILIYGGDRFLTQDVFASDRGDKEHHHWGQSEAGIAELVERFTEPGELVVDPFLGGGTTAVVCRDLGRRFVGCDIDAAAVAATRERLA